MYDSLLFWHSILRWAVLLSLIVAILNAFRGYLRQSEFTPKDDTIRHWTATIAHIQLSFGILLYTQSPLVRYFLSHFKEAFHSFNALFFGLLHMLIMLTAIVMITIGSALAKRKKVNKDKFSTMLLWFSIALFLIFIAIPWPFSPFAIRPYLR